MIVLVVELRVFDNERTKFIEAATENSIACVRDETGCLRFDMIEDQSDPNHFFFYEEYTDEESVQAHRRMPHYVTWRKVAAECLEPRGQTVVQGSVVFSRVTQHSPNRW